MKPHITLAAATALLVVSGGAGAASSGQLTIGQLSYTLTDLDPNDGVTPSISFSDISGDGLAPATVMLVWSHNGTGGNNEVNAEDAQPIRYGYSEPGLSLGGSISGAPADPTTLDMRAYARADATDGDGAGTDVEFWSTPMGYVLSPNTSLTVSAVAHFSADGVPAGLRDNFTAEARLSLGGYGTLSGPFSLVFPADMDVESGDGPVDTSEVLTLTYANDSTASVNGGLSLYGTVRAATFGSSVSPVPEPGRLAMLGAGLPLLLALRRRARRTARV